MFHFLSIYSHNQIFFNRVSRLRYLKNKTTILAWLLRCDEYNYKNEEKNKFGNHFQNLVQGLYLSKYNTWILVPNSCCHEIIDILMKHYSGSNCFPTLPYTHCNMHYHKKWEHYVKHAQAVGCLYLRVCRYLTWSSLTLKLDMWQLTTHLVLGPDFGILSIENSPVHA